MKLRTVSFLAVILGSLSIPDEALACSLAQPTSSAVMVRRADLIVRATAIEYAVVPKELRTTGVPDSQIRFHVESVVKGAYTEPDLILAGYLSDQDDWNDHAVPYDMVRGNGRRGSCFANTYRQGAQFLLLLKRTATLLPAYKTDTEYTVDWYALAPVNEQLHSPEDPWLWWVRNQIKAR